LRIIFLLLAANVFCQTVSIESGVNYFLGNLQKELEISPYGSVGFEIELSHYTNGYLQGSYSYLSLKRNSDFYGLNQFIGRAGIETSERIFEFASVGVGISLAGIRGNNRTPQSEMYMLSSSESEFGWNARLKLNILRFEKFIIGTRFYYDEIWTKPKSSSLLQGGIFVSYSL